MINRNTAKRSTTGDRGPPSQGPEIHTTEQLGPKMHKMANGNLVCKEVPIARVGWMIYGPGETPIEAHPESGYARVYRGEDELFKDECIGSFMGAAVTNEHPDEDVTPSNWKALAQGFATTNVYRGSADNVDILLADLIITDEDLIAEVLSGKREVSCGYDADYTQTAEGEGKQTNIIGNHIALVEKGRCGPRCAIGDREFNQPRRETEMGTRVQIKTGDNQAKRRVALHQKVLDALEDLSQAGGSGPDGGEDYSNGDDSDSDGEGGTHIHIHQGAGPSAAPAAKAVPGEDDAAGGTPPAGDNQDPTEARFQAIEQALQAIAAQLAQLTGGGDQQGAQDDDGDGDGSDGTDDDLAPAGNAGGPKDPITSNAQKLDQPAGDDAFDPDEEATNGPAKAPAGNGLGKTGDSAALATAFTNLRAAVEILVPGFRVPTFDAKVKRNVTIDAMCQLRRKAMDAAYNTTAGQSLIETVAGRKNLKMATMDCAAMATLFKAAVGAKSLLNNRAATGDAGTLARSLDATTTSTVRTIADLNQANEKFWASQPKA